MAAIDLVRTLASTAGAERRTKPQVLALCREFEATLLAEPPVQLVVLLQDVRFAGREARRVWAALAEAGTAVTVLGRDVPAYVGAHVEGRQLADGDPLADVWGLLSVWRADRAEAFVALDLWGYPDSLAADDRNFAVSISRDSRWVRECASAVQRVP